MARDFVKFLARLAFSARLNYIQAYEYPALCDARSVEENSSVGGKK